MPTEAELRTWMHDAGERMPEGAASRIDSSEVIRRSKRRRLPKQLAFGGTLTLAVAGLGIGGVTGLQSIGSGGAVMSAADTSEPESLSPEPLNAGSTGPESASTPGEGAPGATDGGAMPGSISGGGIHQAPANRINLCGGELARVAQSPTGLVLTPVFPASAPSGSAGVAGTVVLTNSGAERITGTTAVSPSITLSQNGVVLWHSNGAMNMTAVMVDLGPGESIEYPASFSPVRCEVEDDLAESFRADLPALPAGTYQVSAAIDMVPDVAPTVMPPAPPLLIAGTTGSVVLG